MTAARVIGALFAGGAVLAAAILLGLHRAGRALYRSIRNHRSTR